jgi:hypothetical protein
MSNAASRWTGELGEIVKKLQYFMMFDQNLWYQYIYEPIKVGRGVEYWRRCRKNLPVNMELLT